MDTQGRFPAALLRSVHSGMATSTAATVLKRKLGLDDVTLFGITCIVGTSWIPAATHTGPASVMLLLLAPCLVAPLAEAANGLTARTIF